MLNNNFYRYTNPQVLYLKNAYLEYSSVHLKEGLIEMLFE